MAPRTLKTSYRALNDRLNLMPQGAPPAESLDAILKLLVSEREAAVLSKMPILPFTAEKAAGILKWSLTDTAAALDELCSRAVLLDIEKPEGRIYMFPPPMAGFFEFSLMRTRGDIDQKLLSELFYQYLNVEEDFVRELFAVGDTHLGRAFVNEASLGIRPAPRAGADPAAPPLPGSDELTVLDHERVSHLIRTSPHRGVGTCYCRHKMMHVGKNCDAPMEICMTFGTVADSLIRHGHAREMSVSEGLTLLEKAYGHDLVQFGENEQEDLPFICNCCGCCCEALLAIRRFGTPNTVNTTNFLPVVTESNCTGCGKCVQACPVEAIALVSANDPKNPKRRKARVDESMCLGCGVCVRKCDKAALFLQARAKRVITPVSSAHRTVLMAIERGKLQNLVFENQAHRSHRAMAALLGAILRLPPAKQIMASEQMKSRYLVTLLRSTEKKEVAR
jgi:ferredoxin